MNKKKIAMLISHYGEDFLTYRINFLKYLENLGYDTVAVVSDDKFKTEIKNTGISAYFYKYNHSILAIFNIISAFLFFNKSIKKEKPDVVFTYKFFPNLIGLYAASKLKIKNIIGTVAGLGFLDKYNKNVIIKIIFLLYVHILKKANYIVVQNCDDKKIFEKFLNKEKIIITDGSGVNGAQFKFINQLYSRKNYNLEDDCIYFIFCSRIVKEKGIFELIEAFNKISIEELNIGLLIAGWFNNKIMEAKVLEKLKGNKKIIYFGYQKNVKALISLSDCVILPSYYAEGIPRTLTEALALSKPIITTNHKGCRETCIDGKNGFLVNIKDIKDLEEKMKKFILLSNEKKHEMGKVSSNLFENKFEQNIIFKKIVNNVL